MNVEEYIASGIIEDYALNCVSAQEKQEVECLSKIYPEIKHELDQALVSINQYTMAYAVEPPADLKAQVLAKLKTLPVVSEPNAPAKEEVKLTKHSNTWLTYGIAASIALLIAVGFYAYQLNGRLQSSEAMVAALQSDKELLAGQAASIKSVSEQHLAIVKNPANHIVYMKEVEGKPDALTLVYWNDETKETFVLVDHMQVPDQTLQYQLWAIVDGKAIDAGVFEANASGAELQQVKAVEKADAFVVTLEKRGGVPVAEGEIYALGDT